MTTAAVSLLAALAPAPTDAGGIPASTPESVSDRPTLAWIDALGESIQPALPSSAQAAALPAAPAAALPLAASPRLSLLRGLPAQLAPEGRREGEEQVSEPLPLAAPVVPAAVVEIPARLELRMAAALFTGGAQDAPPPQDAPPGNQPTPTENVPAPRQSPAWQGTPGTDVDLAPRLRVSPLPFPAASLVARPAVEPGLWHEPAAPALTTEAPGRTAAPPAPSEIAAAPEMRTHPLLSRPAALPGAVETLPVTPQAGLEDGESEPPAVPASAAEPPRGTAPPSQPGGWISRETGGEFTRLPLPAPVPIERGAAPARRASEPTAVPEWAFSARIVVSSGPEREEAAQQLAGEDRAGSPREAAPVPKKASQAAPPEILQAARPRGRELAGTGRPAGTEARAGAASTEDGGSSGPPAKPGPRLRPEQSAPAGMAQAGHAEPSQVKTERRLFSQVPLPASEPVRAPSPSAVISPDLTPEGAVAPAKPVVQAHDAARPVAASPAHQMQFRLAATESGPAVQVHLRDQGGELRVAVRTVDGELAHSMREGLPELVQQLSRQGYEAEVWRPAAGPGALREPGGSEATMQKTGLGGGTGDDGGSGGEQDRSTGGGDSRRREESRPWSDEWQESVGETRKR